MCLPLLPSDRIIEMFNYLKINRPDIPESENEKMKKLLKYYQRYWLEQIGSSRLSVFQNNKRTTNDLRAFTKFEKEILFSQSKLLEFCQKDE